MLKKKYLYFLIIYFMLFLVFFMSPSISRYSENIEFSNKMYIAKPILNLSITDVSEKVSPVKNIEIPFQVTNYNNDLVNDIALYYSLFVNVDNLPLKFKLYRVDDNKREELLLTDNRSDKFQLAAGSKVTDNYVLEIIWNESDKSYIYQNISDYVKIEANVEQSEL